MCNQFTALGLGWFCNQLATLIGQLNCCSCSNLHFSKQICIFSALVRTSDHMHHYTYFLCRKERKIEPVPNLQVKEIWFDMELFCSAIMSML